MFKREKRMHSFIIRAQEILAEGKREESAKMVIQGLQHYSIKLLEQYNHIPKRMQLCW